MKRRGFGLMMLILLLLIPFKIKAENIVENDKKLYEFKINGTIGNVKWQMFKIASNYELEDEFDEYPVDYKNLNYAEDYRDFAYTIVGYIKRDNILPDYKFESNKNGNVKLDKLDKGLYLIISENKVNKKVTYVSEPIIVDLDNKEYNTINRINIYPKFTSLSDDKLYNKSIKIDWHDKGYIVNRPNMVNIQLLENNILKDEIILNKDNKWSYNLENLNANKTYNIVVKDIENYNVLINDDYENVKINSVINKESISVNNNDIIYILFRNLRPIVLKNTDILKATFN